MKTLILAGLAATSILSFSACTTTETKYVPAPTTTTTTTEETTTRRPGQTTHTQTTQSY